MEPCLDCARRPPPYDGAVVWGEYDGPLRTAVLTLKHGKRDELAAPLARLMAARVSLEDWAWMIDGVTFVPSHRLRRIRRGWPASANLAVELARHLGVPMRPALRRRGLDRQTGRTRAQRLRLAGSSFVCVGRVTDRRLLLVDDVTTTGATLARAAAALLAADAEAVYCAAAARTPDSRRMA
jgi:predicted amidophosphoribosyltransferase